MTLYQGAAGQAAAQIALGIGAEVPGRALNIPARLPSAARVRELLDGLLGPRGP